MLRAVDKFAENRAAHFFAMQRKTPSLREELIFRGAISFYE